MREYVLLKIVFEKEVNGYNLKDQSEEVIVKDIDVDWLIDRTVQCTGENSYFLTDEDYMKISDTIKNYNINCLPAAKYKLIFQKSVHKINCKVYIKYFG